MNGTHKLGAAMGLASLAGVIGFVMIGPGMIAGQRVSGTVDPATITRYYAHPSLAFVFAGMLPVAFTLIVFAACIHASAHAAGKFYAMLGTVFVAAATPLYVTSTAVAITLVTLATRGQEVVAMFRLWDVLYNGGAYVVEAGWILFLGLSTRGDGRYPTWLWRYSVVNAGLQVFNCAALFLGLPDLATLPGNLALMTWLAVMSISLGRAGAKSGARLQTLAAAS